MAAGWPTKVTYANGEVYSASDVNDTNGTLNYIDPTSATDNQVLTRDNAAGGKVKWADSPANTLTTTGDLYYASGANTPARLAIGSTNQVLSVVGGVPAWASAGGAYTVIASGSLSGTTLDLTSIVSSYVDLLLVIQNPYVASGTSSSRFTFNGITTSSYAMQRSTNVATAFTNSSSTSFNLEATTAAAATVRRTLNISIRNYTSTTACKEVRWFIGGGTAQTFETYSGYCFAAGAITSAIDRITVTNGIAYAGGTYTLYGVK